MTVYLIECAMIELKAQIVLPQDRNVIRLIDHKQPY